MKTKLLNFIRITAVCTAILYMGLSCKKKEEFPSIFLDIEPRSLTFGYDETGVTQQVTVITSAQSFTTETNYIGTQQGWLTTVQGEGYLNVSVNSINAGDDIRQATINIIVAGLTPQTVTVTQQAQGGQPADYTITLNPNVLNFPASGSEMTAAVTTAGDNLTLEFNDETTEDIWYSAFLDGNSVTVSTNANDSTESRSGSVTISNAQGESAILTINQAGAAVQYPISANPEELIFEAAGGDPKSVVLTTEGSGLAVTVSEDAEAWLTAEIEGDTMSVTASENTGEMRTGTLTVSNTQGFETTVAVTQLAATATSIILEPTTLEFEATGDQLVKTVEITTTSTDLTATVMRESDTWISATIEGDTLRVAVAPQTSSTTRSGIVEVTGSGNASAWLTVTQAGLTQETITGEWKWQSYQSGRDGNRTDARQSSGTLNIAMNGNGYVITGIAGDQLKGLGVDDAQMNLRYEKDRYVIVNGESFTKGKKYYSGAGARRAAQTADTWELITEPIGVTVENITIDGVAYQRITFPEQMVADNNTFPNDSEVWGEEVAISYAYYEVMNLGPTEIATPIEIHDQLVLTREI